MIPSIIVSLLNFKMVDVLDAVLSLSIALGDPVLVLEAMDVILFVLVVPLEGGALPVFMEH